ncbi:hypothetical protein B4133_0940 [Bacillus altitudinis]|nr:hypothetical protein B4133_0940 [Bacillus altitudinis]
MKQAHRAACFPFFYSAENGVQPIYTYCSLMSKKQKKKKRRSASFFEKLIFNKIKY